MNEKQNKDRSKKGTLSPQGGPLSGGKPSDRPARRPKEVNDPPPAANKTKKPKKKK